MSSSNQQQPEDIISRMEALNRLKVIPEQARAQEIIEWLDSDFRGEDQKNFIKLLSQYTTSLDLPYPPPADNFASEDEREKALAVGYYLLALWLKYKLTGTFFDSEQTEPPAADQDESGSTSIKS